MQIQWPEVNSTMEKGPCTEYIGNSAALILRIPKVHYCFHKNSLLYTILNQMNPVSTLKLFLFKIYFNIILPSIRPSLQSRLFPWGFPTTVMHVFLSSLCVLCPPLDPAWFDRSNVI
jgi:hypothetical protein